MENWRSAKARFPKYGDMAKAYAGAGETGFKILMSHDPSHWDGEISHKYGDIDLNLLAGAYARNAIWSGDSLAKMDPVQYVYKQWAGFIPDRGSKNYTLTVSSVLSDILDGLEFCRKSPYLN